MIIIGIDPGMDGAVAAIDGESRQLLRLEDTPVLQAGKGREYDVSGMADLLRSMVLGHSARVVIERAQAMTKNGVKQGVSSSFLFGMGYGIWIGVIGALGIPYATVRPIDWTKRLLKGVPGEGKARSILLASQTFPGIELVPPGCRKPRDGRADAACLAYYGVVA